MPSAPLSKKKCMRLLKSAIYGRLAMCSPERQPYIIPVNYVLFEEKIYIHTGFRGRKIEYLRSNPKVCFEISSAGRLYAGSRARDFSMRYWSILVFGSVREVTDRSLKLDGMNALMEKYATGFTYKALELKDMQDVNVIEISIEKISGKVGFDPREEKKMAGKTEFRGFSPKALSFFKKLRENNNREWFHRNRKEYEAYILEPAKLFVEALGERLKEYSTNIRAVPKVNGSIFRINRDTRFSQDKSPYKKHLGIFLWEGSRPKMECPGFYFQMDPTHVILGGGIYMLSKKELEKYRKAVVSPEFGPELKKILDDISHIPGNSLGGKHYKRIPAGYPSDHYNAEYLLYNGLYAGVEEHIPEALFSENILDYCVEKYNPMLPLHRWLVSIGIGEYFP